MEGSRTPTSATSAYDAETLADLTDLFGRPRLMTMLAALRDEIDTRLEPSADDPTALGREAHAMVSTSGALGFMTLSRACVALEQACLARSDVPAQLEKTRAVAADAKRAIDELRRASP